MTSFSIKCLARSFTEKVWIEKRMNARINTNSGQSTSWRNMEHSWARLQALQDREAGA